MTPDFDREWSYGRFENAQYNRYLRPNRRNFRVLQEIVVKKHDGDVILYTGLGYGADATLVGTIGGH